MKQNGGTAGRGTELGLGGNGGNVQVMMFTVLNLGLGGNTEGCFQQWYPTNDIWETTH